MSLGDGAWTVGGGLTQLKAKQGGIHGHTDLFTYLPIPYLPKPKPAKGLGGVGARFHNASPSKLKES